jgi:toxin-antitoxin system PIN domain toxin
VIAVDANLLVYAHRRDSPFHGKARALVTDLAAGTASWCIPWPCLYEFYGIATHPRLYRPASTTEEALAQIEAWSRSPSLILLSESDGHWSIFRELVRQAAITGPMVHDAKIAALCLQHGVQTLWTADRDFSRFPQLRCRNPLMEAA